MTLNRTRSPLRVFASLSLLIGNGDGFSTGQESRATSGQWGCFAISKVWTCYAELLGRWLDAGKCGYAALRAGYLDDSCGVSAEVLREELN